MLSPRSWRDSCHDSDALRRFVTAACPEFKAGQIVEVDLPARGHLQKVVGRGPQNVESLDAAEVVIVVFHDVFPFAVGFLEDAETGSRTNKPAGHTKRRSLARSRAPSPLEGKRATRNL